MAREKIQIEAQHAELSFQTRRHFLKQCRTGMGMMALGSFLDSCNLFSKTDTPLASNPLMAKAPHFAGKAKSVIFLHMVFERAAWEHM